MKWGRWFQAPSRRSGGQAQRGALAPAVVLLLSLAAGCTEQLILLAPENMGAETSDAGPSPGLSKDLSCGRRHTLAIANGLLFAWGEGVDGQLGTGDQARRLVPTRVGVASSWTSVKAGFSSSCGLRADGQVWCWGFSAEGALGLGALNLQTTPRQVNLLRPAIAIALRFAVTLAILDDGSLWGWGASEESQLLQPTNQTTPVRLGERSDWIAITAGQGHACGLRAPGTLWCWGRNTSGHLGLSEASDRNVPIPTQVGIHQDWLSIEAGQNHTCGLRAGGELWCWGNNVFGALGLAAPEVFWQPTLVQSTIDLWATDTFHSCALGLDGGLLCTGRNVEGQLGFVDPPNVFGLATTPTPPSNIVRAATGRFHTCVQGETGQVACTGQNAFGQLGLGDEMARSEMNAVIFEN